MKITFENMPSQEIQNRGGTGKAAYAENHTDMRETAKKAEKAAGYSVNIGNQNGRDAVGTYKKDEAVKDRLSMDDISAMAANMDMDVQKMYMAVMSNSMSAEEFGDMMEEGYHVTDIDIETVVTILDQIKVAVAKGGGEISGFTDDISKETMAQILGSSAYAEALENGVPDASIAYMVEQEMEPTPENLYRAKYSAGNYDGQNSRELPEMGEDAFREQVDKVISEAGYEVDAESRQDAEFLLKYDIPLTKENLQLYKKLKPFGENQERISEEELKSRIAMQVYEGKAPKQADLSKTKSIYEEAVEIYNAVQELTLEETGQDKETEAGKETLTLRDLIDGQGEFPQDKAILTARRQLEEVRLSMTVEANIRLLRSGFQIDIAPMEQLIKELRAAEEILSGQGIPQATEAVQKLTELQTMPVAALSFAVSREISFTVAELHEKGSSLQADYQKANERYETMQTTPRADMGDSIRKAFRNVDDILTDMNKEPSEENRRAVRMLGYNQIELTEENLERALEMDRKVQNLFRDMKPGKVLQMIRDGVDVLHTDIEELDAYLTVQKSEFAEESEDFAKFLHKLDRNGEITPAERENYIGIYRLIRQVEKADGKAEGYLLGSEAEATMENLLTAIRSSKKGSMDYKIDESFAGVDAVKKGQSIVDQIMSAPQAPAGEAVYAKVAEALKNTGGSPADFRKEAPADNAVDFLKEMAQPVTVSNLIAASSVLQEDASIYQKIEDYEKTEEQEEDLAARQSRMEGYIEKLQDSVTAEETLQEGMEEFAGKVEEILREAEEQEGVTELDIRDMQRLYKGIRFRTAIARESRYQIPVKSEAGYAVMNLTVRHGMQESRAEISIQTESHGRLEAVFTAGMAAGGEEVMPEAASVSAGTVIRGTLFAEKEAGLGLLQGIAGNIRESLSAVGIATKEMTILQGKRIGQPVSDRATGDGNGKTDENTASVEISTKELYQIAKIFLETVRNEC